MANQRHRIPKLRFSSDRYIGWHACYRDPATKRALRKRFPAKSESEAKRLYREWLADHMQVLVGRAPAEAPKSKRRASGELIAGKAVPGSLLHVASTWLAFEKELVRIT